MSVRIMKSGTVKLPGTVRFWGGVKLRCMVTLSNVDVDVAKLENGQPCEVVFKKAKA